VPPTCCYHAHTVRHLVRVPCVYIHGLVDSTRQGHRNRVLVPASECLSSIAEDSTQPLEEELSMRTVRNPSNSIRLFLSACFLCAGRVLCLTPSVCRVCKCSCVCTHACTHTNRYKTVLHYEIVSPDM
jgi:hypothetical protein